MYHKKENGAWVRQDLDSRQKEFCMCWDCEKFKPNTDGKGCPIIKSVLDLASTHNIVLPVWECLEFNEKQS